NNKLEFFSKSGVTEYGNMFKEMFYKELKKNGNIKNIVKIQDILASNDYSVTFEVINVEKDKHIVTYDKSKLVILDVIENNYKLNFNNKIREELSLLTGFEIPKNHIINNEKEFDDFLNSVKDEENTEGYVFKDNNNYMFKLKNNDYKFIKSLRGLLYIIQKQEIVDFNLLPNWLFFFIHIIVFFNFI
ncbi:RNA ligase, partial [Sutterella wadsworthensis]|uniref:RNA ligase n=1 Tax=Sutterella wadsworthensis TaxID=40545 RepID=UPI0032C0312E